MSGRYLDNPPYSLFWNFISGIMQDYGLDSADHPDLWAELNQSVGEANIDTFLEVLDEHTDDPRIAAALAEARGEPAALAASDQSDE